MPIISKAKHLELEKQLKQFLAQHEFSFKYAAEIDKLKRDGQSLQVMYTYYQQKIHDLLHLIKEYQEVHNRTRVQLRKMGMFAKETKRD